MSQRDPHDPHVRRPRHLVIKAMTTPELIKRWLGGVRATVVSADVDLRVGGTYRYVLRPRTGPDFGFGGSYREVGDHRIVQTEAFDGYPGESLVTTTLTERAGKTTLDIIVRFASQEIEARIAQLLPADAGAASDDPGAALTAATISAVQRVAYNVAARCTRPRRAGRECAQASARGDRSWGSRTSPADWRGHRTGAIHGGRPRDNSWSASDPLRTTEREASGTRG